MAQGHRIQVAPGGHRAPGSPEGERQGFFPLLPQDKEKETVTPTLPGLPWVRPHCSEGRHRERRPPALAAVRDRQIAFPAACPFLTQGTETHHFMASGFRRTSQDGR